MLRGRLHAREDIRHTKYPTPARSASVAPAIINPPEIHSNISVPLDIPCVCHGPTKLNSAMKIATSRNTAPPSTEQQQRAQNDEAPQ